MPRYSRDEARLQSGVLRGLVVRRNYWALGFGAGMVALVTSPATAQARPDDNWSSIYIGVQAAGSNDTVDANATLQINQITNLFVIGRGLVIVPGTTRDFAASDRDNGISGGGFAGYQRQLNNLVIGIEGDFTPFRRTISAAQSQAVPPTALTPTTTIAARRDISLDDRWSARLRLGYAAGKTLFYATGGYARTRARVTASDSFTNPGGLAAMGVCGAGNTPCQFNSGPEGPVVTTSSASRALSGWTAGGGIERKIGRVLSIGIEYRRTDLGGKTFISTNAVTANTGPTTMGDAGGLGGSGVGVTGLLGMVQTGPTRIKVKSDALSLRLAIHF